jgi:DNA polymerase III alpha subunit (gram-positive type)
VQILFFDTETTGLVRSTALPLAKQPRIIEFYGATLLDPSTPLEELSFRCNPGVKLSAEITKVTGIIDDDLISLPPFEKYADDLKELIINADMAVAHNLQYDRFLINCEFERLGRTVAWPKTICTVEATEFLKGYRLSLGELYETLFKATFDNAHSAKGDVQALIKCFDELMKRGLI